MAKKKQKIDEQPTVELTTEYLSEEESSLFYGCPRFIWIGSMKVEIQVMHSDAQLLGGLLGLAQPDQARIVLAHHDNPNVLANTAIHEVIHCINRNRDVRGGHDEEHITDQIATGLCDFRVFNPDFFSWWEALLHA